MEYRLLGDVEVCESRGSTLVMSTRQRTILAVLLYRINTVVSRQELIRSVWGTRSADWPLTAERLTTDYVSRLRAAVGRSGALRLVARPPGFVALGDELAVDWHRFRRLVADARAVGAGDVAVRLLRTALELWRGSALADLPSESLQPVRARMTGLRLMAAQKLAALEEGNPASVIETLDELCAVHPEHEMLATLLVRALHQAGRRDAAVAVYKRSRDYLAGELGLDPGNALESAYRAMLVPASRSA
jgi:DNA-binding SARP family transcriptional activator